MGQVGGGRPAASDLGRLAEQEDEHRLALSVQAAIDLDLRLDNADAPVESVDRDARLLAQPTHGRVGMVLAPIDAAARKLPPQLVAMARVTPAQKQKAPLAVDDRDPHRLAPDRCAGHVRTTPSGKGDSFSAPSAVMRKLSSTRSPPPPSQ